MSLDALVAAEIARPLSAPVTAMAQVLADRVAGAAAVLFYGSNLRSNSLDGVLDFYVLTDRPRVLADRLLPPNVSFAEWGGLRAKVAVMTLADFRRAMRPRALSPHLWARFCQPVALAWSRDDDASAQVRAALVKAIASAAWWAERLAPPAAEALSAWTCLFRHTYGAELRAEAADRPRHLIEADPRRWRLAAQAFTGAGQQERRQAARSWAWRRPLGRVLAGLRLVKAAFTVAGGVDYLVWKIERHTGRALTLSPWQRRHPLLAALPLLVRLRRDGIIR